VDAVTPGVEAVIVGLETLPRFESLAAILEQLGPERVIFSLDLVRGQPRTIIDTWTSLAPLAIAEEVARLGVRNMIVLDLADVGMQRGPSTHALAKEIRRQEIPLRLIGGGGVRHLADMQELNAAGFDGALVASALHDGRLTAEEITPDHR
jgi:phosphoribosylformimino-5-aminoimidazole carboxamide ribotide isomerase